MTKHHTFFNIILLPEDKKDEAFAAWKAVGEYMQDQPGFLGSMLYRSRRNPLRLINLGRYTDVDSFLACVQDPEFQRRSRVLSELGVEREADLYDEVHAFGGADEWS